MSSLWAPLQCSAWAQEGTGMRWGIGSLQLPTVGAGPCAFKDPPTDRRQWSPDEVTECNGQALVCVCDPGWAT